MFSFLEVFVLYYLCLSYKTLSIDSLATIQLIKVSWNIENIGLQNSVSSLYEYY